VSSGDGATGIIINPWYVIQTRPQKERVALGLLSKADYEVFLPTIRRGSHGLKPLFPRYFFLRSPLIDPQIHHTIRFTRGVTKILSDTGGPIAVAPEIIETIRAATRDGSIAEPELLYKIGDRVRVKEGVLQDLIGIVEKNVSDDGRVQILFSWLSRKVRVKIDYRQMERAG
jgi:transcription antitermination factor NusG